MASQTKTLQVKITSIRERVHQPWRNVVSHPLFMQQRELELFAKDPKMAKISYDPDMLADQLAKEFNLDRRDISCERMHKDLLKPSKKSYDGIVIPFLVLRSEKDHEFLVRFFSRAMAIQGVILGDEFFQTMNPIVRSYLAKNNYQETNCPKCSSRLKKIEQRRKDHVLVTLTCPNKPWCKWGTSRVVPLTGPRAALSLSVDHGEDLGPEKPVETLDNHAPVVPPAPAISDWSKWPPGSHVKHANSKGHIYELISFTKNSNWEVKDIVTGDKQTFGVRSYVTLEKLADENGERVGRIGKNQLNPDGFLTIRAQKAKPDPLTQIDPQDWSTWPVGTIVGSEFTKQAELCEFKNGNWVALIGGAKNVLHQSSNQDDVVYWKVKQWDWRNWKPGTMVLSQNRGACQLEKYEPNGDFWIVTSMSDHCTLTLCLREETKIDEPIGTTCHEHAKKEIYHPIPEVGMQVILVNEMQNLLPRMTVGRITGNSFGTVTAKYNTQNGETEHNWIQMSYDSGYENSCFWRDNMPLEAYIKNEWVQFHDELYVGLELKSIRELVNVVCSVGSKWKIENMFDNSDADFPTIHISGTHPLTGHVTNLAVSPNEISEHFIPTSPDRG